VCETVFFSECAQVCMGICIVWWVRLCDHLLVCKYACLCVRVLMCMIVKVWVR